MKFSVKVKLPGEDIFYEYDEKVPLEEVLRKVKEELTNGVLEVHVPNSYSLHFVPVFNNIREVYLEIIDATEQIPDEMKELMESDTDMER